MTFLYPRLLRPNALSLAKQYRELSILDLQSRAATSDESAVYVATGGTRLESSRLQVLRDMVVDLAKESGFPGPPAKDQRTAFDLRLARLLHSQMDIAPAEAASGDVWAFLAVILLPDVAYWRYPPSSEGVLRDRFLGGDLTRHVFGRMWWRAHFVYSPEEPDPYAALSVLGESEFDQIYARRTTLGGRPQLIKSILRVWREIEIRELSDRDILRDFLKRLLRLDPFLVYEALDDFALDTELRAVARETIVGLLISKGYLREAAERRAREVLPRF
ncbi:DUF6339 family protein [Nocardia vermiculata]|uniref:Uncharacterized protein n=1 Tax=Nocardia vermiculata TaxID=257274 RepID=A0A846Y2V9_9NOCA|nr:DUF6339 family protein [Nocardia vermiculata]NKY52041.1 hypothetical protein [Nocardia vermiculata]